jgi:hypothetical protein
MDYDHEIASLSAETLAIQTALASVLYHLGKESPALASAIRRGLDDAASKVEDFAIRAGKAARPEHGVKAIRVVEELRKALGYQDKPRNFV